MNLLILIESAENKAVYTKVFQLFFFRNNFLFVLSVNAKFANILQRKERRNTKQRANDKLNLNITIKNFFF